MSSYVVVGGFLTPIWKTCSSKWSFLSLQGQNNKFKPPLSCLWPRIGQDITIDCLVLYENTIHSWLEHFIKWESSHSPNLSIKNIYLYWLGKEWLEIFWDKGQVKNNLMHRRMKGHKSNYVTGESEKSKTYPRRVHREKLRRYCWWQPEIRRSPVEVGSLSHYVKVGKAPSQVQEFWTINSMTGPPPKT